MTGIIFWYGFVCLLATTPIVSSMNNIQYDVSNSEALFDEFVTKYGKVYANDAERKSRFEVFKANLAIINERNAQEESATFGINFYSDLSSNELLRKQTGFKAALHNDNEKKSKYCTRRVITGPSTRLLPEAFNWRDSDVVTSVKQQRDCGSCWAFSAVANIESQYYMKNKRYVDLSEQQIVDCDPINNGCNGGLMSWAMEYVMRSGGVQLEEDYEYVGSEGVCKNNSANVVQISGCVSYDLRNEERLRELLVSNGPISVAIDVMDVTNYQSGIARHCSVAHGLNHAVLLVGYGVQNNTPYWVFKNSWGSDWGESGYFRVLRDVNSCGMLNQYAATAIL